MNGHQDVNANEMERGTEGSRKLGPSHRFTKHVVGGEPNIIHCLSILLFLPSSALFPLLSNVPPAQSPSPSLSRGLGSIQRLDATGDWLLLLPHSYQDECSPSVVLVAYTKG